MLARLITGLGHWRNQLQNGFNPQKALHSSLQTSSQWHAFKRRLFVNFRHTIIAATIRKKQAKQPEVLASPHPIFLIHEKTNRKIQFGLHRASAAAVFA